MRRRFVFSLGVLLSVLLGVSVVLGTGIVDVSKLSLLGGLVEPLSPGTTVFVDPRWYVQDYSLQPIGSKFTVHVNITEATDLFTWQVNITWNKAILSVSKIIPGTFLAASPNQTTSEVLTALHGYPMVINATDNTKGYSGFAESILGTIAGQSGNGRLASIEFLVVGYGCTYLTLSLTGDFGTTLISSTGGNTTPLTINGFFDNRIPGDITGPAGVGIYDGWVDGYDLIYLGKKFGTSDPVADFTGPVGVPDGAVDGYDLIKLGKNFGKHYP